MYMKRLPISLYNSLSRAKEPFAPINPPFVGLYVCGPTVYGDPHLGHARTAVAFDVVFRVLQLNGYRVRYVRNITDVGHLEDETAGAGEDKIAKRARIERVEPMEVVQRYTVSYHDGMRLLGCLTPSIEPRASGHILEQIEVVQRIIDAGLAYEVAGSVYFDVPKFAATGPYGKLSGKVLEELQSGTRETTGQEEKRSKLDFALWKRAEEGHIMRWNSPWGSGFPGWHVECTTMSTKYLGEQFDLHGGGMDLQFPHHEAEIAQNHGAFGTDPARYWMHSNMLTVDGQKMSKSLGNFITLEQMFAGTHPRLERPFTPMVLRFFMLQAHYRSTVDFSAAALQGAEKGYQRLMDTLSRAERLAGPLYRQLQRPDRFAAQISVDPDRFAAPADMAEGAATAGMDAVWAALADDFHTPRAIAALFEVAKALNVVQPESATETDRAVARDYIVAVRDALGLVPAHESAEQGAPASDGGDAGAAAGTGRLDVVVQLLLQLRKDARQRRDFATADAIRDKLAAAGVVVEDRADGTSGFTVR